MIRRLIAIVLLASTTTTTALATKVEQTLITSGAVLTREKIAPNQLPPVVRETITALDAKCRSARGRPGKSPNLLVMVDFTYDGRWDYVIDANDYVCEGAADAMRGKEGAALTVFLGGPSNSATLIYSAPIQASRIIEPQKGRVYLSVTDDAECGHADAVNLLNSKWEWCRQMASWNKVTQKFQTMPRPWPGGPAALPLGAVMAAAAPRIAGAPPPLALPPQWAETYARPVAENVREAVRLLTAAVDMGDAESMWSLGNVYAIFANGQGVDKDYPKAIALWRRGAEAAAGCTWTGCPQSQERGVTQCMLSLARAYEAGMYGLPRDKAQSDDWYRRWAKTNPPFAASTLARRGIQP